MVTIRANASSNQKVNTYAELKRMISVEYSTRTSEDALKESIKVSKKAVFIVESDSNREIVCHTCGKKGHKSFECRGKNSKAGSSTTCSNCNRKGHSKDNCWAKGGEQAGKGPNSRSKDEAHFTESRKSSKKGYAFLIEKSTPYSGHSKCNHTQGKDSTIQGFTLSIDSECFTPKVSNVRKLFIEPLHQSCIIDLDDTDSESDSDDDSDTDKDLELYAPVIMEHHTGLHTATREVFTRDITRVHREDIKAQRLAIAIKNRHELDMLESEKRCLVFRKLLLESRKQVQECQAELRYLRSENAFMRHDLKSGDAHMSHLTEEHYPGNQVNRGFNINSEDKHKQAYMVAQFQTTTDGDVKSHIQYPTSMWLLDSGASDHMTYFKDHLDNYVECSSTLTVANKQCIKSYGYGSCLINGVTLKKVLFVPDLCRNLITVRTITAAGFIVTFQGKDFSITTTDGASVMDGSRRYTPLYTVLDLHRSNPEVHLTSKNATGWHQVLGHVHLNAIKRCGIPLKGPFEFCATCASTKSNKLPFAKSKLCKSIVPLDRIHMDLCGPMHITGTGGERYYLAITDDCTGFVVVYPLKQKSEATKEIIGYINWAENQLSEKVLKITCDGGKEFINNELETFCVNRGIEVNQANPYTPEQNGVAERMNRTLIEGAKAMIKDSGLPKSYWPSAVATMAYIRNRIPSKRTPLSPYTQWTGKEPDYERMQPYGAICYMHKATELRKKFDDTGLKCIFIGYSDNGYR